MAVRVYAQAQPWDAIQSVADPGSVVCWPQYVCGARIRPCARVTPTGVWGWLEVPRQSLRLKWPEIGFFGIFGDFVLVWVMHDPYQYEITKNAKKPDFRPFETQWLPWHLKPTSYPGGCHSRAWPYACATHVLGPADHRPRISYRLNGISGLRLCVYAYCHILLKWGQNRPIWGGLRPPFFMLFQGCTGHQEGSKA